jgi:uncharacterized protein YeaO (DUF488 family)
MLGGMTLRIVRLGSPRFPKEGLRIGTVRRPPRGVPKADWARRDFFDVWLPILAPTEALLKEAQGANDARSWKSFARRFKSQMKTGDAARTLDLLASLSSTSDFSIGCYCADEAQCHRSVLRELLQLRGASIV